MKKDKKNIQITVKMTEREYYQLKLLSIKTKMQIPKIIRKSFQNFFKNKELAMKESTLDLKKKFGSCKWDGQEIVFFGKKEQEDKRLAIVNNLYSCVYFNKNNKIERIMTIDTPQEYLNFKNLEDVLEHLKTCHTNDLICDHSKLPIFDNAEYDYSEGVWSYSETHKIIGESSQDMKIVEISEKEKEEKFLKSYKVY